MNSCEERFTGLRRLFGREGERRLRAARVCVVGLGGVGSWAAEALARSAIGALTLVDMDTSSPGNVNRQLHAIEGDLGTSKAELMARRIRSINPECVITAKHAEFSSRTGPELLRPGFDFVLDAIDRPTLKALLVAMCCERGIPVIVSGGAAGRTDPTRLSVSDLAHTSHDRLLQEVRRALRRNHGFPRGGRPFGVECIVSREPASPPLEAPGQIATEPPPKPSDARHGLGTACFVTAAFGLVAAGRIVVRIAGGTAKSPGPAVTDSAEESRDSASSAGG